MELLSTILSGGTAGAVAAFLMKMLLDNHLERSQRRLQHELDQEKQERRAQLEVLSNTQKIRPASFVQKNIEALEVVYSAVAKTSLPRHNFQRGSTMKSFDGNTEEQETEKYFQLFAQNFNGFIKAFDSVSNAFQTLEDKAIYLTPELEHKIIATLQNINDFYQRRHSLLTSEHEIAKKHFDGNAIPRALRSFDFAEFNLSMGNEWRQVTSSIREELKNHVRMQLMSGNPKT